MTLDRSLRIGGAMSRHRSVLTRAERIATLMEEGKFDPAGNSPMGLPKVAVKHSKAGHKVKKEEKPVEGAEAAAAAPAAGAAVPAVGAKGAPVAKGAAAKGAPAAKGAADKAAAPKTKGKGKGKDKDKGKDKG
jgi:small basic protein (TIGR04137 family)